MSSVRSPLQLELTPSPLLRFVLSIAHGLALLAVHLSPIVADYRLVLAALIGLSWVYYWFRLGYQSPWFINRLHGSPGTGWLLRTASGREIEARLLGYYLHPYIVVLWFGASAWRRRSVIILKDNISENNLRRLRIALLDGFE